MSERSPLNRHDIAQSSPQQGAECQQSLETNVTYGTVPDESLSFSRQLSTFNGFALLISIIIGSGIFASPSQIDAHVASPGSALIVWCIGGILSWTGAATLAGLGTAFPGDGGIQAYLRYIYGDFAGFLAAWSWVVAVMPATLAILSIVFVDFVSSVLSITGGSRILDKLLSILVLVIIAMANSISTRVSTKLGNMFVAIKLISVATVAILGLIVVFIYIQDHKDLGGSDWHKFGWFNPRRIESPDGGIDWTRISRWDAFGHWCTALYASLWAYSGWDKANYIAGELRSPTESLPIAINSALPVVIFCFIAVNAAYYVLLPWSVIPTTDAVAVIAIQRLLGPYIATLGALMICLVVAGSLSGNVFVVGRLTVAAARRAYLPSLLSILGRVGLSAPALEPNHTTDNPRATSEFHTSSADEEVPGLNAPFNALFFAIIIASFYILFGNFHALLTFDGMVEYTFFFLTVIGDIILRFREPQLPRRYKPNILIPMIFCVVSGSVVVREAIFAFYQFSVLLALLALGLVFRYENRDRL